MDFKKPIEKYARALYDNVPEIPRELPFKKGDILTVLEENYDSNPEWWVCSLRNKIGLAPANRLEAMHVLNETKPEFLNQMADSTYDTIPGPLKSDNCYFNIESNNNISSNDETYSAYQFPREEGKNTSPASQLVSSNSIDEHSVYQIPSDNNFDETYSNTIDQPLAKSNPNKFESDSIFVSEFPVNSKPIQRDSSVVLNISPDEATEKYKELQADIVDRCNKVIGFVKSKWNSEEMLRLNGDSLRQSFIQLNDDLTLLLNFANSVYQNSLKCNDMNLIKKMGKHISQLHENKETIVNALEKLKSLNWEPDKIAISVRLAVKEGSDSLGQVILAARNILINTRSLSVTINGNASILFSLLSLASDNCNDVAPVTRIITADEDKYERYKVECVLSLFTTQIKSQAALVNDTVDDFIRFLANRNQDSNFIKSITSNSKFVLRGATQLVCITRNLSDTQLKWVPCDKIDTAGSQLCDLLNALSDLIRQFMTESHWSMDQKEQINQHLKMVKDSVNNLQRVAIIPE